MGLPAFSLVKSSVLGNCVSTKVLVFSHTTIPRHPPPHAALPCPPLLLAPTSGAEPLFYPTPDPKNRLGFFRQRSPLLSLQMLL